MRLYLDNCCYNRPFDDQRSLRIRLEAEATLAVQEMVSANTVELAWSYVLDFENEMIPFEQRKVMIRQWRSHAAVDTSETGEILLKADQTVQLGLKGKDALHLACTIASCCDYFLTTDDYLIKKTVAIAEIKVTDPITFLREELERLQTPN